MKLPNHKRARVELGKVRDYLLSPSHPIGRAKAKFFTDLGFSLVDPSLLAHALERAAEEGDVVDKVSTGYGIKYVLDGAILGPRARGHMRTVWSVEEEGDSPRLVTAYPVPEEGDKK